MTHETAPDVQAALRVVTSAITCCEKMCPKFAEGTSHHSLLRNRLQALYITKALLEEDHPALAAWSVEDLYAALPPVRSIRHKNEKARSKYEPGDAWYRRFTPAIQAMDLVDSLIQQELSRREDA